MPFLVFAVLVLYGQASGMSPALTDPLIAHVLLHARFSALPRQYDNFVVETSALPETARIMGRDLARLTRLDRGETSARKLAYALRGVFYSRQRCEADLLLLLPDYIRLEKYIFESLSSVVGTSIRRFSLACIKNIVFPLIESPPEQRLLLIVGQRVLGRLGRSLMLQFRGKLSLREFAAAAAEAVVSLDPLDLQAMAVWSEDAAWDLRDLRRTMHVVMHLVPEFRRQRNTPKLPRSVKDDLEVFNAFMRSDPASVSGPRVNVMPNLLPTLMEYLSPIFALTEESSITEILAFLSVMDSDPSIVGTLGDASPELVRSAALMVANDFASDALEQIVPALESLGDSWKRRISAYSAFQKRHKLFDVNLWMRKALVKAEEAARTAFGPIGEDDAGAGDGDGELMNLSVFADKLSDFVQSLKPLVTVSSSVAGLETPALTKWFNLITTHNFASSEAMPLSIEENLPASVSSGLDFLRNH